VQLRGPYTLWHHTHTFEERGGGTLCLDDVRYRPRGGALTNWLFVRRDVKNIFAFRSERLAQRFRDHSRLAPGKTAEDWRKAAALP
jgi:ligand-binding SRPBCC domain-containing protein